MWNHTESGTPGAWEQEGYTNRGATVYSISIGRRRGGFHAPFSAATFSMDGGVSFLAVHVPSANASTSTKSKPNLPIVSCRSLYSRGQLAMEAHEMNAHHSYIKAIHVSRRYASKRYPRSPKVCEKWRVAFSPVSMSIPSHESDVDSPFQRVSQPRKARCCNLQLHPPLCGAAPRRPAALSMH